MWLLSGGRITREAEHYLLWELPLPRALQYYHCALRANLAWTVKPTPAAREQLKRMEAKLEAFLAADAGED